MLTKGGTTAIQIRTGICFSGFLHIVQGDGSGAVLVVEGENQFIIVQVNGVHKCVDQHFAVGLLAYIQLTEFVEPEGNELRADSGLGNLFVGDLDFQIFFRGFQFLQAGLGGFGEDSLLDGVQEILAPFPILMDKKSFVIMEMKGVQIMENNRKKGTPPPRYDDAFKAGAVRMVTEQGRPSAEVAKELGICIDTLRSWLKTAGVQPGQADRQNRDNRKMRDLEAEVRALRKQLAEKDEVIDILKKSVGILSKP